MLLAGRWLARDMKLRSFLLSAYFSFLPSVFTITLANSGALAFAANSHPTRKNMLNMSTVSSPSSIQILPMEKGSHNSAKVVIAPDFDRTHFRQRLQQTIDACRSQEKTSLWIEVPMSCAGLMEEMSEFGLEFHHAQGNTASLNVWLVDGKTNKIPEFATHHVGVGALVVNSRNEILCVRELRHNFRPWKLPGGLSDLGEDIPEAACREVLEETGIECKFQSIMSFRHTHKMAHGRSDLYFVCRLEPVESVDKDGNTIIPEPVACEEEIEAAAWVPMEEYQAMINGKDGHPMMQQVMKLYDQDWKEHDIQQTVVSSIVPGRKPSPIYHPPIRSTLQSNETQEK